MHSPCYRPAGPQTLKMWCVRICIFYSSMCLASWPLTSEAAKLRCGSDLLSDLIFVCGERGVYLGKGSWSGYGSRPRGKGIVDQCCRSAGCELQHLEMYCAKPKGQNPPTTSPATTTASNTTTQQDMFQAVFQKRLLEHLGAPNSPKREAYRKKTQPSHQQQSKVGLSSLSRRRLKANETTSGPPTTSTTTTTSLKESYMNS
ncbi:insulin-like growth factor 3 [Mugil cephalus]|uniref:insulin-like growth factor 3 n=1 Tax=Mugil cephalus TaxID=48193 RepID=UPI001FB6B940|nr:insulin-like growth factor 3 [Mugil cephalus]